MYFFKVFLWLALLVAIGGQALACELCPLDYRTDLSGSIAEADIIVYAERDYADYENDGDQPEIIDLFVHNVLYWSLGSSSIMVYSWIGMCPYGLTINDSRQYIIFLEKGDQDIYRPVYQWCGVKALPVVDDKVIIDEWASTEYHVPLYDFLEQQWRDLHSPIDSVPWRKRLRSYFFS